MNRQFLNLVTRLRGGSALHQRQALHTKAQEIRETWDGMATITIDETEGEEIEKVFGGDRSG